MRLASRIAMLGGAAVALPTLFACIEHPLKPVEYEPSQVLDDHFELTVNKDVDILFIMDNSGSMGEEQANLAANFGAFIEELEAEDVKANYRIGITTTDNGNPRCGATTTPEAGSMVMSSCQGRLEHFVFTGTNPPTDVQDIACTDICPYGKAELDDQMAPTTTDLDPNPKVRPWLENLEGKTNLPDGISTVEAFQCFGPQGIDGCGFESHLESMYKAVQRTKDSSEASYGFMRDSAILAVIIVTDEVDCSYRNEWKEIFEPSGNRVFWSDPNEAYPSSAVCWNAGVQCEGGPGSYEDCHSVNYDVDGNVTTNSDEAVLHPTSRYVDLIAGLEANKKMLNPDQEIIVGVISGVPDGYYLGQSPITYADSPDSKFQTDFGVGPGCSSSVDGDLQTAIPPVRMREWAENFGDRNLYSVCSKDYTPALKVIAAKITDQIGPACYKNCVKDADATTDGLQPDCIVEEEAPGAPKANVPECRLVGDVYEMPSADDNVCYHLRTDPTQSGDPLDDMADECIEDGFNLEFEIVRRDGFPAAGGTAMVATCQLSENSDQDCPMLGN